MGAPLAADTGCPTASGSLSGSGTASDPYLISSKEDLQEFKDAAKKATYWAANVHAGLTANINMAGCVWDSTIGIDDTDADHYFGVFDGNGFSISGLDVDISSASPSDGAGLFGEVEDATISNVGFTGDVTGDDNIGGLVGWTTGDTTISNVWASGDVVGDDDVGGLIGDADGATVTNSWASGAVTGDDDDVGGLIGNAVGATVTNSWASGAVTGDGTDDDDGHGGLIGDAEGATVTNSWASGAVTGDDDNVGGLIGFADEVTTITNSWASGAVTGADDRIGGLIGDADGVAIRSSWATGTVTGDTEVGGLVGYLDNASSSISASYATGTVTSTGDDAGGLVGDNDGAISTSFSTGAVIHNSQVLSRYRFGGLVGINKVSGSITDSYATGSVDASDEQAGGLVGNNEGTVVRSYSVGQVSADADAGGLIGINNGGSTSSSYWNIETSGLTVSAGGSDSSTGGSGKTTEEMREIATFVGWSISEGYNPASTWGICGPVNSGYPYLTAFQSGDPCVTPPTSYQFTFRLPDGTECGAIGPVGVIDGTIYILPGEDADCRTMDGATVGGWTIPVPEGYDSIGSPSMPFAPGQKVRVSDSQQFTVVPFEPLLSLTLDSNVMATSHAKPTRSSSSTRRIA